MADKNGNGKKSGSGGMLDLMDEQQAPARPRPSARAAKPQEAAPNGDALFGAGDVDSNAKLPADVPVGDFPAPSQVVSRDNAPPASQTLRDDAPPVHAEEEDPFADDVMAQMLADEPAPILSPLRAAREDMQAVEPASAPTPADDPHAEMTDEALASGPSMIAEEAEAQDADASLDIALKASATPAAAPVEDSASNAPTLSEEPMSEARAMFLEEPAMPAAAQAKAALPAPKNGKGKRAARGLTFPRRYTQAGQDVWATTEYDLRTASIVGSDGTVVFEQKGVEIPKAWSQLATNVVVSKYFRGHVGTLEREYSVKQLIGRVSDRIMEWGRAGDYFAAEEDAQTFHDELRYILLHQYAAFNSPVWFNLGWQGRRQAVSACYINEVDDTMESILDLYKTEGMLFKDGSGSGLNLSVLRSSKERLAAGGKSSGPISFMKGLDASAGSIKSGGSTRRAACMRVLDIDHPDIAEFIDCKKDAELKAHALIDAGYSGAFNVTGGAYDTVPFQNANHSVRVTDEFMQAVEDDGPWDTRFRTTGKTAETVKARDLMRGIAEGTWVCGDPGMQYDTTINEWHTCLNTDRIYASNPCSEYMFLNSTACNLSSLNLMKFRNEDASFDVPSFEHAVRIMLTAQEIVVGFAAYPTAKIEERSHVYRTLGLGYANLGALLMAGGLPYDSAEGRAYAGAVTAIMTGTAYHQSAAIARDCGGPFSGYAENTDPMLRVIGKHRQAVDAIDQSLVPHGLWDAAARAWDSALAEGTEHGYRNAQVSVLAPTGTIGFLMDCDTTGIEPDIAIVKYKTLVGGGMMKIVNQTVPEALQRLGYSDAQVQSIVHFIDENDTVEGAPDLKPEHLPIFDCAFRPMNGTRSIHYRGHIKMMAAAQPFISGAISKTVNVPEDATPEDIAATYIEAWRLGLKAIAVYRDNSKKTQPLNTGKDGAKADKAALVHPQDLAAPKAVRHRLPDERVSLTHKFSIGGHEGYLTVGLYPDTQQPGEIFIRMSKEGSSISGLMDSFATAISLALQYGVPLQTLVDKFIHSRFEPSGFTGNKEIPMAKSVMDYIFRYLALKYIARDQRQNVGLIGDQDMDKPAPANAQSLAHDSNNGTLSGANGVKNGVLSPPAESMAHLPDNATASITEHERAISRMQSDAPPCPDCGAITIRSGACYKCLSCGTSLGCS